MTESIGEDIIPRVEYDDFGTELKESLRSKVERLGYCGEIWRVGANAPKSMFCFAEMTEALKSEIDMKLVELLTSAHLGLIWSQKREAVKHGGDIYFAAPGKLVMEAFEAISLTSMMKIFDSVEDALAAFAQESEDSPS